MNELAFWRSERFKNIDWTREILNVIRIIGKIALRILSYVLNIVLTLLLVVATTAIIVGTVFALYIKNYVDPTIDSSMLVSSKDSATSRVYYYDYETEADRLMGNGTPVEMEGQRLHGSENSLYSDYSEIPEDLINAFICYEDHRFWSHSGVDWWATAHAVVNYALQLGDKFGASTITQQLVKNITGDDEVKITRKVQEILRALYLESTTSKEDILTMYLNIIYLGNNCYGVKSAAETYFGKELGELTVTECAALAAIVKNPSRYEPARHVEENKEQRGDVLYTMWLYGAITEGEYQKALGEELNIVLGDEDFGDDVETPGEEYEVYSWYTEALIDEVRDALMEKYDYSATTASLVIFQNGLQIYSVMDPEVQDTLEEVYYNDDIYFPTSIAAVQPESAMVIVNPYNGDVLGLIGGRGEKYIDRGLNRATHTKRPPGSSIKPLSVYAPGINEGVITWSTVLDDVPVRFNDKNAENIGEPDYKADWVGWPANLPAIYYGLTTVADGLQRSANTIAVRILQKLGVDTSFDYLRNKLQMDSIVEQYENSGGTAYTDKDLAPLALGQLTKGVSVLDITAAYSIFTNNGVYNEPRFYTQVLDSEGNVILGDDSQSRIVISDQTATIMTKMMQNVVNYGTAQDVTLRNYVDVAGKTGTSNADYDRWFVGYSPYYIGGVWVGYDNNLMLSDFWVNPASNIWNTVMLKLHQKFIDDAKAGGEPLKKFEMAADVVTASFCKDSGKLISDACKLDPRGSRVGYGYFTADTVPTEECDVHVKVLYDPTPGKDGGVALSKDLYTGNDANLIEISLIKVEDRSFPIQINVTDAQYVYRELPEDVRPAAWWGVAFWSGLLDEEEYAGSSPYTDYPYNRFCWKYFDYSPWDNPKNEPKTDEPLRDPDDDEDADVDTGRRDRTTD